MYNRVCVECVCINTHIYYICACIHKRAYMWVHVFIYFFHSHTGVGWIGEVPAACVEDIPPMQNCLEFISSWFQSYGFVFQAGLPSPYPRCKEGGALSYVLHLWVNGLRLTSLLKEEVSTKRRAFSLCALTLLCHQLGLTSLPGSTIRWNLLVVWGA